MAVYFEPIKTALILFPIIAFFITLPYLIIEYHKYGAVPLLRSVIVYTFILYLLAAFLLVILPLPSRETVLKMPTRSPQLVIFTVILLTLYFSYKLTAYVRKLYYSYIFIYSDDVSLVGYF